MSLKTLYGAFVEPFAARPNFRTLRAFFVFWPLFGSTETEAEKAVRGEQYDSWAKRKIAYGDRGWRLPHGWEWWEFNDEGDINPDYENYMRMACRILSRLCQKNFAIDIEGELSWWRLQAD